MADKGARGNMHEVPAADVLAALSSPILALDDTAVSHLAQGLNASLLLAPTEVQWTAWYDRFRERLRADRTAWRIEPLSQQPWKETLPAYRFWVSRTPEAREEPRGFFQLFRRRLAVRVWEHDCLSGRCRYAPTHVFLDGRRLDRPELGGDRTAAGFTPHRVELFVLASADAPDRIAAPPIASRAPGQLVDYLAEPGASTRASRLQDFYCTAMLALMETPGPTTITFVKHGITLESRTEPLGPRAARIVCCSDGLRTDLSQTRISEDGAYRDRLDYFRHLLERMEQTAQDWKSMSRPSGDWSLE